MKTWIVSSLGCWNYSRVEIIQGRKLFAEIRYILIFKRVMNKNPSLTFLPENFTTPFPPLHTLCAITALFSNKERIEIAVKIHNTYSKSEICDSDVPYVSGHNPRLAMLLLVSGSRYIFCELSSFVTMGSKFVKIQSWKWVGLSFNFI